ncbi:NUDIX domain-containing protein [Bifidobacterium sp. MA2]|uniref:NUDIX domain-containing protein n=1 Tax=Bifidobacterium santillanense TaxID=2809028 RepID=A0ABS5UP73_9BIFI|nr:NUDIX hydrolase [Bifidobacterium santillanense]MBT1172600.1 NUDIX domain-containing protein [Bifidobacterium santillanense]
MITPADLARMLSHAAPAAVDHAQNGYEEDVLLYTSESVPKPRKSKNSKGSSDRSDAADDDADDAVRAAGVEETIALAGTVAPQEVEAAAPSSMPTPATVFARVRVAAAVGRIEAPAPSAPSSMPTPATVFARRVGKPAKVKPKGPSPANMPRKRGLDGPTKFASLDAQELPVVREYSAGGLVFDELGRVAIIARHSRSGHLEWCLPKGHIEKGESPQQTAVREVHEETGILGEVVDSIATIDYWFTGTTQRVHKLVHHFALRQVGGELTVDGDPDHEAEDAIWVDFKDLDDVLSYPNERKIAWLYARKLNRQADE